MSKVVYYFWMPLFQANQKSHPKLSESHYMWMTLDDVRMTLESHPKSSESHYMWMTLDDIRMTLFHANQKVIQSHLKDIIPR